jgi:hypothetical protein
MLFAALVGLGCVGPSPLVVVGLLLAESGATVVSGRALWRRYKACYQRRVLGL